MFLVLRNKNLMKYTYILVSSTTAAKSLVPTSETQHLTGQLLLYQKAILTNRRTFFFFFKPTEGHLYSSTRTICLRVIISIPGNWTACLLKSSERTFEVSQVINTSFFRHYLGVRKFLASYLLLMMVTAAMKLKDAYSLEEKLWPT